MVANMLFGRSLRKERNKQKLTVEALAKICGVSRSYITLIESGKRLPGKRVLPRIAPALNLKNSVVLNWYLDEVRERLKKFV